MRQGFSSPDKLRTHCVAQAGLKRKGIPSSAAIVGTYLPIMKMYELVNLNECGRIVTYPLSYFLAGRRRGKDLLVCLFVYSSGRIEPLWQGRHQTREVQQHRQEAG